MNDSNNEQKSSQNNGGLLNLLFSVTHVYIICNDVTVFFLEWYKARLAVSEFVI